MEVDWAFFGEVCRALALKVSSEYDPEVVLGIAKPGVIPGVVIASILQRDFASMALTRHEAGGPPQLVAGPPASVRGRDILLVDETCDSGDTLKLALNEVLTLNPKEVRTAVSFRTGSYEPDFYAFETDKVILLPWDREIIEGDELVLRPEYAHLLEGEG
jgi:hypoxanthine phosphoribosyltransferase